MNKIKQLFVFAILIASVTFTVQAQPNKQKGKSFKSDTKSADTRAKEYTDTLQNVLKLSPTQYEQTFAINKDFYVKRDAIRASAKSDTLMANKAMYKQQNQTLKKTRRTSIETLLTPEQKTAWQIWQKQKAVNRMPNSNGTKESKVGGNSDDEM